uniref:DUF834 domain-containing protein n=1 Tax=Oryza sativa subsp. japonica TaxID=39947 RepID=Q69PK8_ORYSJ|nr:hypothetical protein [Oryza sativa Japonica Group]
MTEGAAGPSWRSKCGGELGLHGDDGAPVDFGFGKVEAALPLFAAVPLVMTALTGDGGVDAYSRLELLPATERERTRGEKVKRKPGSRFLCAEDPGKPVVAINPKLAVVF